MFARSIAATVLLASMTVPVAATADDAAVVAIMPSKTCTARSATAADLAEVAYSPEAFAGKCVSLRGYWRDLAVYPTRAEAAQPDARSMSFLDRRRIGLYLSAKDDARAPGSPAPAHLVGVVGNCADLIARGAKVSGYCSYKMGAYFAVSSVVLDKWGVPMRRILIAATAALAVVTPALSAEKVDLLIRHAAVIDMQTGQVARDRLVAVRGDSIVAVAPDSRAQIYRAHQTVDATGKFVMPGLWDMHVHFGGGPELIQENRDLLPLYLAYGITSIRDCAGDLADQVLAWRDEIRRGALLGPTLYTSGPKLEGYKPIWKGVLEVGTEAEVNAALDRLQGLKVDFIKITDNTLKPELFLYAVREATKRGLKTSAHIPAAVTVEQASAAGLTSIEHMSYALRPGAPDEGQITADVAAGKITGAEATARTLAHFDSATAKAAYRKLAANGTFITPTLNGSKATAYLDQDDHQKDAYLAYLGPGLKKTYEWRVGLAAKDDAAAIQRRHERYEKAADLLPLLRESGMTIIAGTDAGFLNSFNYPGVGLHDEMAIFVAHGMTPLQTLQAATLAGPKYFGTSARYGAVASGKAADLLILDGDPVLDIAATRTVRGVVLRGRYLDREVLDGMLAETKAKVARAEAGG